MRRRSGISGGLVACILITAVGTARAQQPGNPAVDAIFADLTRPGSPGCALGIYRDGKVIYAKGYGLANVEENVPITPETVFDIGSVSKQFTAAAIVLLQQQDKLRLDDDVRKYVPELPDYSVQGGRRITIFDLLSNTVVFRDIVFLFLLVGFNFDNVTTDQDALGSITRQKGLNFSPGSDWQYSGSGYFLLSLIVKQVSGKNLRDFAAANIFHPLGMSHTEFRNDHSALIPRRAMAYDVSENGGYKLSVSYAEETGDGMLHTTIEDLQKWDENFYSGSIGGKNFAAEMERQARLDDGTTVAYAKGLFIANYRGLRTVWHSGASAGYRAYLSRFPDRHFSVACLCNRAGIDREKRVRAVADLYLSEALKPTGSPSTMSLSPAELRPLAGIYRDPKTGDVWRVSLAAGKLWVEFEESLLELRPLSPTEFQTVDYPMDVHLKFEPARGDAQRRLIVDTWSQLPAVAEKIAETKPGSGELVTYAGDYWSDELRATYRFTIKDDKLWMKELIGADGVVHEGTVPFDELRPVVADEFDLKAPMVIHFMRNAMDSVIGFTLNGFHERGILFSRSGELHSKLEPDAVRTSE